MTDSDRDIYDPQYVRGMFDRMADTYGLANLVWSFGFTARWRRQCIDDLPPVPAQGHGYDLMSGMGEAWHHIQRKLSPEGRITAVDISSAMHRRSASHLRRLQNKHVQLVLADVLDNKLPSSSADFVVSTFGLKTFSPEQQERLAAEIARLLRPGGAFSLIEISRPDHPWLRVPFMFYLRVIIPLIGRLFLGNPEDYRMLGRYCTRFGSALAFQKLLQAQGLDAHYKRYFGGCATGVFGQKKPDQ